MIAAQSMSFFINTTAGLLNRLPIRQAFSIYFCVRTVLTFTADTLHAQLLIRAKMRRNVVLYQKMTPAVNLLV